MEPLYEVWRMDLYDNWYPLTGPLDKKHADAISEGYTAKGHHQTYFVFPEHYKRLEALACELTGRPHKILWHVRP